MRSNDTPFIQSQRNVPVLFKCVLICLSLLTLRSGTLRAQIAGEASQGVAWRVRGPWQVQGNGASILTGDAIQPGSLLQPGEGSVDNSITVLLPDGQRILYECFTPEDCARGFRVPPLYRKPEPFAVDMLARIHAVLVDNSSGYSSQQRSRVPRDEVMVVLGSSNRVEVAGLAAALSNGRYTYDIRPLDPAYPRQSRLLIEKTAPSISIALPSAGLYVLTITDALNTPRIDLFIAAVGPAQSGNLRKSFHDAHALMEEWNEDYQGWPIHDFQRAYLQSLMLSAKPLAASPNSAPRYSLATDAGAPSSFGDAAMDRTGVTAEPVFSPEPGLFDGDTAVTLQCNTPGATMHFTVDGSQPVANSSVYRASIIVKGTELTIKSFASVAGKNDSAVVTGIFRIQH